MYSWCWQKKKVDTFDKRLYVKWKDDLLKRNGADVLKKKNYACPALILFCYLYLQEQGVQNKWKSKIINMYTVIHCKQCTLYNLGSAFFPELTHSYKNICFSVCDEWLSIYVLYTFLSIRSIAIGASHLNMNLYTHILIDMGRNAGINQGNNSAEVQYVAGSLVWDLKKGLQLWMSFACAVCTLFKKSFLPNSSVYKFHFLSLTCLW